MKPSIGRIVHYIISQTDVEPGSELVGKHFPAIITACGADAEKHCLGGLDPVNLEVFGIAHFPLRLGVQRESIELGVFQGTWHWPEREEDVVETHVDQLQAQFSLAATE